VSVVLKRGKDNDFFGIFLGKNEKVVIDYIMIFILQPLVFSTFSFSKKTIAIYSVSLLF